MTITAVLWHHQTADAIRLPATKKRRQTTSKLIKQTTLNICARRRGICTSFVFVCIGWASKMRSAISRQHEWDIHIYFGLEQYLELWMSRLFLALMRKCKSVLPQWHRRLFYVSSYGRNEWIFENCQPPRCWLWLIFENFSPSIFNICVRCAATGDLIGAVSHTV